MIIEIGLAVNEYMSITEAAERLGVDRQRIYQMIQERKLTEIRFGKTRVVLTSEIEKIRQTHTKYQRYSKEE